jgi:hypothetical protein
MVYAWCLAWAHAKNLPTRSSSLSRPHHRIQLTHPLVRSPACPICRKPALCLVKATVEEAAEEAEESLALPQRDRHLKVNPVVAQ